MGGEPLDQPLIEVHRLIEDCFRLDVELWLFTKKPLEDIDYLCKFWCNYIKSGRYIVGLPGKDSGHGFKLASDNQVVYKKGEDY